MAKSFIGHLVKETNTICKSLCLEQRSWTMAIGWMIIVLLWRVVVMLHHECLASLRTIMRA